MATSENRRGYVEGAESEVRRPDSDLSLVTQQLSDLLASLSPLAQTPRLCLQSAFDSFLQIRYLVQVCHTHGLFIQSLMPPPRVPAPALVKIL